jgi:exodeoxyribonuclease VII small subunit
MAATKKFSFTSSYKELEKIVADFESRELDLEKDLPKFERGLELAHKLQKRLKEIENKVVEIDNKFSEADDENDE